MEYIYKRRWYLIKRIDKNIIKTILRNSNTKNEKCTKHHSLILQLIYTLTYFYNFTEQNTKAYELALWIRSKVNQINNKGKINTTYYKPKQILYVDLGNNTYGFEFSYYHPCVVIYNEYNKIFIVPCSSKKGRRDKNGNLYPEYLEGNKQDGFSKKTTLRLNEAKFIDKTRVLDTLGSVKDSFYDKLYNKLFQLLFESKNYSLEKIQRKQNKLEKQNQFLKQKIRNLKSKLEVASRKAKNENKIWQYKHGLV